MKRIALLFLVMIMAACTTTAPGPFYDIREVDGVRFFIATPELKADVQNALREYAPLYGLSDQEIEQAAFVLAGELFITEEAMRHFLNSQTKPNQE